MFVCYLYTCTMQHNSVKLTHISYIHPLFVKLDVFSPIDHLK